MFEYVFSILPPSESGVFDDVKEEELLYKRINAINVDDFGGKITPHNCPTLMSIYRLFLAGHPDKHKPLRDRIAMELSPMLYDRINPSFWDKVDWLQSIINNGQLEQAYRQYYMDK